MKQKILIILIFLILFIISVSSEILWDNLNSGGVESSSANFIINDSIGQSIIGKTSSNSNYHNIGYWFSKIFSLVKVSISGRVLDENRNPIKDVKIQLTGFINTSLKSNSEGYFCFTGLTIEKDYSIKPVKEGYSFIPQIISFSSIYNNEYMEIYGSINSLDLLKIYPNPVKKKDNIEYIMFSNVPPGTNLKIYDISGMKLFEVKINTSEFEWNLKNSANQNISSGIYFYILKTSSGDEKIGKIAIIK
ncbi:MAG: T9SS type A sorting domain-containing protein [bacterium]|nr:T9SS type A sorting domain-containing protein [bacterium]